MMKLKSRDASIAPSNAVPMIAETTENVTAGATFLTSDCTAGSAVKRPAPNVKVKSVVSPTPRDVKHANVSTDFIVDTVDVLSFASKNSGSFV
mmetsp:Transcript_2946/g.3369  ORF Transcript_2946/g.3369 Transcript_2946/m.3369 type:complete len:93 (+) Transcript_2946:307-585(+)